MYTYAWYHWITFFYLYCFFGWIFESAYVSLKQGRFVNRGFLRLPMLPLYGTGAVMMLWVSLPVKEHLVLVYFSGVIAATLLEYVTGWAMEQLFKVKYWDYSNQRFNLNGYICLSSSIAWGFLTILMTEVIHRPIERLVLGMNPILEYSLLAGISLLFACDTIQSTKDALNLARALEAVTRLRGELDELQMQLALLKSETEQHLQELKLEQENRIRAFREEQGERLLAFREEQGERLLAVREEQEARIQAFLEQLEEKRRSFLEVQDTRVRALNERLAVQSAGLRQFLEVQQHRILGRNPSASSSRFTAALRELRKSMENHRPF